MVFSQFEWPNGPIFNDDSCWPTMYVMQTIFRNCHYVDLQLMFPRLAYGMSYATLGGSVNWQMVLPLVHQVDLSS
jgi:hypothetical protein